MRYIQCYECGDGKLVILRGRPVWNGNNLRNKDFLLIKRADVRVELSVVSSDLLCKFVYVSYINLVFLFIFLYVWKDCIEVCWKNFQKLSLTLKNHLLKTPAFFYHISYESTYLLHKFTYTNACLAYI